MNNPQKSVKFSFKIQPNSQRNRINGLQDGVWVIKVAAPATEGKANRELISFLSKTLGVAKSRVVLLKGQHSRNKLVEFTGVSPEEITAKLNAAAK